MTDVGMNLAGINYWGTEEPFIDRMKTSGEWTATDGKYTSYPVSVPLNQNHDPAGLPAGTQGLAVAVGVDPFSTAHSNSYVLTYSGSGTFDISGGKNVVVQQGKITFDFTGETGATVTLRTVGMDPADPVHDLHLVRADQVDLFNKGEVFNPEFLEKIGKFDTLRFMDWENTNTLKPVTWADRTTLQDASWAYNSDSGVPIEAMVKLCNQTHSDMWFNVPTEADDDYVKQAMTYIRDNLDPSLKVHVEYSNEVWNLAFDASRYSQHQADQKWGVDANHDGTIDDNDPKEAVSVGWEVYYGYRAAQVASIANGVFGGAHDGRLENVITTQPSGSQFLDPYVWDGVARANLGAVSQLFDDFATTTYFGRGLQGYSAADQATVVGWARSGAAGLDAAFHELEFGGSLSYDDSLANLARWYPYQAQLAKANGLDLVAYEGGAHITAGAYSSDVQAEVFAFFTKLFNDPRMGQLYTKMIADFSAGGGTDLNAYDDVGSNTAWGYWGVLDDIYQDHSPRYDALVAALQPHAAVPTVVDGIQTALSTFTLDAASSKLTFIGAGDFTGTGNELANTITGGAGADHLFGAGGNDVLMGGAGNDALSGQVGNDTIDGGAGNDTLDGGTGQDVMKGGAGDDSYVVDDAGDVVTENPGEGTDTVSASVSYTIGANVENLTITGSAGAGTGNDLNNVLTDQSNSGNSTLNGLGGNDVLNGGAGVDRLNGGDGDDTLNGGAGADYLTGGKGVDTLTGGAGADRFVFAPGDLGASRGATDTITDFSRYDLDRIDLSAFRLAGQPLHFINGNFAHHVGELRLLNSGGGSYELQGDLNGDGVADLDLVVKIKSGGFSSYDFIL